MEHGEEVLRVLVDLRALALRQDVLEVERVPVEPFRQLLRLLGRGGVEVDPGQTVSGELSDPRLTRADRLGRGTRTLPLDAGQARHGD
jgi:hypothetical protein